MKRNHLKIVLALTVLIALVFGFAQGNANYTDQLTFSRGASCKEIQAYASESDYMSARANSCKESAIWTGIGSAAVIGLIGLIAVTVVIRKTPNSE
ncbi:MAG: hypothetical protein NTX95_02515 [Actinobacteria bacterium]|nr:hypothetical protein [Actinomycetota bacterium]